MKRFTTILITFALATLIVACSDSSNPLNITPTGSSSLLIDAAVSGSDQGGAQFQTDFSAIVMDSLGAAVTDAAVTISHGTVGVTVLTHDTLNPGTYSASRNSYTSGIYTLGVIRGTDFVTNVMVTAPDLHVITYPTTSDSLFQSAAFTVLWTRTVAAQAVAVETRDYTLTLASSIGDTDDGSFTVPAGNTLRDDQRVRVWRYNSTVIGVARTGSTFDGEIRNSVEPIVVR